MALGTPPSTNGLVHGTYLCPGLHGKDAVKQDIQRKSFADLLAGDSQLVIPTFQRSYCWHAKLAESWWRDIHSGSRFNGQHSTGKTIFFPVADEPNTLLVIDGQQRLTTSCLCVAALRDRALHEIAALEANDNLVRGKLEELIAQTNRFLYRDIDAAAKWCKEASQLLSAAEAQADAHWRVWSDLIAEGECPDFLSLIPSFHDRAIFGRLVLEGPCGQLAGGSARHSSRKPAVIIKNWFDRAVAQFCQNRCGLALTQALEQAIRGASQLMGVMSVRVLNPPAGLAQQVFLWYQENSLIGEGAQLLNPCPGVSLAASDLARNLVLAPLLSLGTFQMNTVMRDHWFPLERRFRDPAEFDAFLERFVSKPPVAPISPAVAHFSAILDGMRLNSNKDPKDLDRVELYTKFVSAHERILANSKREARTTDAAGYPCSGDAETNDALHGALAVMAALNEFGDTEVKGGTGIESAAQKPSVSGRVRSPGKRPCVPAFEDTTMRDIVETK